MYTVHTDDLSPHKQLAAIASFFPHRIHTVTIHTSNMLTLRAEDLPCKEWCRLVTFLGSIHTLRFNLVEGICHEDFQALARGYSHVKLLVIFFQSMRE
jgi:hypothetical protein